MLSLLQAVLTVAYPLLVWLALGRLSPRAVGLMLVGLVAIRFVFARFAGSARSAASASSVAPRDFRGARGLLVPIGLVGLVAAGTAIANDPIGLLAAPVLVNAALFVSFATSLRGTPLVEQLARLQVDTLAPAERRYCRRVTLVWCGFFVANGAVAGALALRRDPAAWALYTGLLSYLLMGALFAAEYVYRHARFRRYVGSFTDPLLARLFPPRFAPEWLDAASAGNAGSAAKAASGEGAWRIALEVPTGLACWPGHFPGEPMVPGVVLVDWALAAIERRRGRPFRPEAIDGLKFKQPVRPADRLELELSVEDAEATGEGGGREERIAFTFRRGDEVVAEGRFRRAASTSEPAAAPAAPAPPSLDAGRAPVWPEPEAVLVHAPPMVWLVAVEAHDAAGTTCRVEVDGLGAFREPDGGVGAHAALEWMAQCVAAHAGLDRRARGERPCLGLLLGSKRVRFARAAYTAGESFRVEARPSWVGDGGAAAFDCRVESRVSGETIADARLSCFMPQDGMPPNGRGSGESDLPMNAIEPGKAKATERAR